MKLNKTLVALAVAGGLAAPAIAMADAGAYGRINVGLASQNDDAAGGDDSTLGLNSYTSHVGFRGSEDLGNGLTANYQYEFAVDAVTADIDQTGRLGWVGLSGDFGEVQAGMVNPSFYNHVGVITDWGWSVAAAPGYYALWDAGITLQLRQNKTVKYSYAGDGFSFGVDSQFDGDNGETSDIVSAGLTIDLDVATIGLAHLSTSMEDDAAEPSATGVSFTVPMDGWGVRGSYVMGDRDTDDNDSPSALDLLVHGDLGGGLSGFLGVSMLDNDMDDDTGDQTIVWGHIAQSLSARTSLYAEFSNASVDGGDDGDDTDPRTIIVGVNHQF